MKHHPSSTFSKVPVATAGFWVIKILATTVGEVGGNEVSMNLGLGYLAATVILAALFLALTFVQVRARRFHPWLYWATILASTTAGTTLADYVTRSIGIGYTGGSLLLLGLVIASLVTWRLNVGTLSADDIADRRSEFFYWLTITVSQTLGTALGDWFADVAGLGYAWSTVVIAAALAVILLLHHRRAVNAVILFWAAFVLTRPLGAVFGNLFDKPPESGGMGLSRPAILAVMLALMGIAMWVFPQRAKKHKAAEQRAAGPVASAAEGSPS
jgi:uncharacterized membrane-anchored protein